MAGEDDLTTLFATMEPKLHPGTYAFLTVAQIPDVTPLMMFQEEEGTTLILPWNKAEEAGLKPEFPCCWITLNVHSSLEAVGFLAPIATPLAAQGMSVNPVAGYYHDHLFLPAQLADAAMAELRAISSEAQKKTPGH